MSKHKVIAIDLAKNVFQVCCINRNNRVIINKALSRKGLTEFIAQQEPTIIAMEACYSSHFWGRAFRDLGHTVKLIPAQHVTPFVRGNKSDKNDATAIAEAAQRPNIKPVPIKSIEQQDVQTLHRMRERHISQRTGLMNQTRGLLSEYGLVCPIGHKSFRELLRKVGEPNSKHISPVLKVHFASILDEYYFHSEKIDEFDVNLRNIVTHNPLCQILLSIPGIGFINASALYSAIGDGSQFTNAREFAVWLGLTPKQFGSGGKTTSAGITKRGNRYLRKQLVHGARAITCMSKRKSDKFSLWINQLLARKGPNKTYVAVAARLARIAWTLLDRKELYVAQT